MPANTIPIFTLNGNFFPVRITSGNTGSDGSGNLFTVVTGGTNGTRVDGVRFRNAALASTTSSATQHKIFLTDTNGLSPRLVGEVATAAGATRATATNIGATSIYTFDQPLILQPGQLLRVSQSFYASVNDQFDACAFAGDY